MHHLIKCCKFSKDNYYAHVLPLHEWRSVVSCHYSVIWGITWSLSSWALTSPGSDRLTPIILRLTLPNWLVILPLHWSCIVPVLYWHPCLGLYLPIWACTLQTEGHSGASRPVSETQWAPVSWGSEAGSFLYIGDPHAGKFSVRLTSSPASRTVDPTARVIVYDLTSSVDSHLEYWRSFRNVDSLISYDSLHFTGYCLLTHNLQDLKFILKLVLLHSLECSNRCIPAVP